VNTLQHIAVNGVEIAVRARSGKSPGLVWLGGFRSDMIGSKAEAIDRWASETGRACTRHDYSGHGESKGRFVDGTISRWLAESLAVFRQFTRGPQILIGSSMGGWIALRMIQELNSAGEQDRIAGLILLAPAPDFTTELMEPELTGEQKSDLEEKEYFEKGSDYSDEPDVFTRALFDDGRKNRVLTGPIDTHCPIHICKGRRIPTFLRTGNENRRTSAGG